MHNYVPLNEVCIARLENQPNQYVNLEATTNHLAYVRMWIDEIKKLKSKQEKIDKVQFKWIKRLESLENDLASWIDVLTFIVSI